MARASEDELIARYFAPLAGPAGLGLADDAALFAPREGHELVLTVDALVAGVHFLPDDPPDSIAAKALGVNLSDLAAKGAEPAGYLLVLALPDGWTEDWLAAFCTGLDETARATSCSLIGGDTVRAAGPLTLSVTAMGEVPVGRMIRRTGAKPEGLVCVTGAIGDAVLGLALSRGAPESWADALDEAQAAYLVDRYRRPRPRLALAPILRDFAHGAMDVSDGLVGDLAKMLRASGATGTLDLDRVPFSSAAKAALQCEPLLRDRLATGGDDYEILFTISPDHFDIVRERAREAGIAVSAIGTVEAGEGPLRLLSGGRPHAVGVTPFQHFGGTA